MDSYVQVILAWRSLVAKVRVLVAEDNQAMREIIVSALAADFDVILAVSDGESAVAANAQLLPDVAVLDISMPILNGIDVARRIRETCTSTQVIFLSAHADAETVEAAFETGSLAYVLKPRLGTDLVPAIKLALNGRRFVSPGLESLLCHPMP
jgi:DNA-binding NarL/FixJ family response regulator